MEAPSTQVYRNEVPILCHCIAYKPFVLEVPFIIANTVRAISYESYLLLQASRLAFVALARPGPMSKARHLQFSRFGASGLFHYLETGSQ